MSVPSRAWLSAATLLCLVVALDQLTKAVVRSQIEAGERREVLSFLDLVHVRNDGVAFGALAGNGAVVIAVVAIAFVALCAYFFRNAQRPWVWLPTGLLLGGAVGNAIDRIRLGAVTDFVKFPHWPAFNVADSAITIGVIALLTLLERGHAGHR